MQDYLISIKQEHALLACNLPIEKRALGAVVQAMLCSMHKDRAIVDIFLVDAAESAILNQQHLGCSAPTNILSFPTVLDDGVLHGDLVLCIPVFLREVLLYGQDATAYLLHLLAHGLLHLAGYEHGEEMDRQAQTLEAAARVHLL